MNGLCRPAMFVIYKMLHEVQIPMRLPDAPAPREQEQQLAGSEVRQRLIVSHFQTPRTMVIGRRASVRSDEQSRDQHAVEHHADKLWIETCPAGNDLPGEADATRIASYRGGGPALPAPPIEIAVHVKPRRYGRSALAQNKFDLSSREQSASLSADIGSHFFRERLEISGEAVPHHRNFRVRPRMEVARTKFAIRHGVHSPMQDCAGSLADELQHAPSPLVLADVPNQRGRNALLILRRGQDPRLAGVKGRQTLQANSESGQRSHLRCEIVP